MKTLCRNTPRTAARGVMLALLTLGGAASATASSLSTLLDVSNNQNWQDPAWGEVTILDDDTMGAGGIKFIVNLCDNESPQCTGGYSDDYGSGQNTIEQFGFNFDGSLTLADNIKGAPSGWELHTTDVMDGFGSFLYALSRGNQADTVEPLIFWIVASGDSIDDYASIGSTGGQPRAGGLFAVKVAARGPGAFIGDGGAEVPLPGTLGLLGLGLAGLGVIRRKA